VGGVLFQLNLVTLLVAWGISEVIRYGFFAAKVRPVCVKTLVVKAKHKKSRSEERSEESTCCQ